MNAIHELPPSGFSRREQIEIVLSALREHISDRLRDPQNLTLADRRRRALILHVIEAGEREVLTLMEEERKEKEAKEAQAALPLETQSTPTEIAVGTQAESANVLVTEQLPLANPTIVPVTPKRRRIVSSQ